MTYRVLVTGSRTWHAVAPIHKTLDGLLAEHPDMLLIHGACSQGADAIADRWATLRGVPVERHPAEWRRYKPSSADRVNPAGQIRNAEMVKAGAGACVAFIADCANPRCRRPRPHGSHGATRCASLAEEAGIEVRRWPS